jgi:starch synthase
MILLSHPTGNANVREAARAMNEAGLLSEFWTSVSWNQERLLNRVLPRSMTRELERRAFPHLGRRQLHHHPWVEFGRLAARQLNLASLLRHEGGRLSVDAVYRSLDSRVADRLCDAPHFRGVYAYEDGALVSFRAARQLGIKTIYELPIGYWRCHRDLMQEEASRQPEWAATMQGSGDSDEKLRRKDDELALATDIVVSSDFVRSTLRTAGQLQARVSVLPYGAPPQNTTRTRRNTRDGKLKVLFVGALSQRKGLSYLLQAVTRFGSKIELTIIGRRVAECRPVDEALRTHRWIPSLPHAALLEEMSHHDVMVFPSLFEGCALVILEAMSQGLPVIATPNTGAAHFISDGNDGFIVPIRDVEAIVKHLEALLLDRDRLVAMSQAARSKASHHSWQQYRQRLVGIVRQALTGDAAEPLVMSESGQPEVCPSC